MRAAAFTHVRSKGRPSRRKESVPRKLQLAVRVFAAQVGAANLALKAGAGYGYHICMVPYPLYGIPYGTIYLGLISTIGNQSGTFAYLSSNILIWYVKRSKTRQNGLAPADLIPYVTHML